MLSAPGLRGYDPELVAVLDAEPDLALRALAVERDGVENPRKDLRKWSDFRPAYAFFFPQLFLPLAGSDDERLAPVGVEQAVAACFRARFRRQLPAPGRPGGMVQPDPRARGETRLRLEREGIQEGPGCLPWLDPRSLPAHPGRHDRLDAQP